MDGFSNHGRWIIAAAVVVTAAGNAALRHQEGSRNCGLATPSSRQHAANPQSAIRHPDSTGNEGTIPYDVQLCQALGPAAPYAVYGVDSAAGFGCGEVGWSACRLIPWQEFAQGEYVGHARTPHVPEYRLREGDVLAVYYRRTREELSRPYELQVGDRIRVESLTAGDGANNGQDGNEVSSAGDEINRELVVQPDGTITLPLLGQVRATRQTVPMLREDLERRYEEFLRVPSITVTPIAVNTRLEDLMDTVDSRAGTLGGRQVSVTLTPAGDIQLPGVNNVFVQGLTLAEAKQELDARYNDAVPGVRTTLVLVQRAKRFVYVIGEVGQGGRFELEAPTTVMQALAMAGGWTPGANLKQVVVFRRAPDWRLMATMLDLGGSRFGSRPVPADDIWLNDSDIVLVPSTKLQRADELIEQIFTRGVYAVAPPELIWGLDFAGVTRL